MDARLRTWARDTLPGAWVAAAKDLRSLNLDRRKMRMTEEEREVASAFFRDDVLKTQDLVGIDLSRWLRDAEASGVRKGRSGETEPTSRAARAAAP